MPNETLYAIRLASEEFYGHERVVTLYAKASGAADELALLTDDDMPDNIREYFAGARVVPVTLVERAE